MGTLGQPLQRAICSGAYCSSGRGWSSWRPLFGCVGVGLDENVATTTEAELAPHKPATPKLGPQLELDPIRLIPTGLSVASEDQRELFSLGPPPPLPLDESGQVCR